MLPGEGLTTVVALPEKIMIKWIVGSIPFAVADVVNSMDKHDAPANHVLDGDNDRSRTTVFKTKRVPETCSRQLESYLIIRKGKMT